MAALALATPTSEEVVVARLAELSDRALVDAVASWLENASATGWVRLREFAAEPQGRTAKVHLDALGTEGEFRLHVRPSRNEVDVLVGQIRNSGGEVCHILIAPEPDAVSHLEIVGDVVMGIGAEILVVSPEWATSIAIEQLRPLLFNEQIIDDTAAAPYFEGGAEDVLGAEGINVRRSSRRMSMLSGSIEEDRPNFEEKLRDIKRSFGPIEGSVLLASVFMPPITHSQDAVRRFYDNRNQGLSEQDEALIHERYTWEHRQFEEHIEQYQRIDVIDRAVLSEYLSAPEYYQMPLTVHELRAQINNVIAMLEHDNYTLCLCPESVNISFELRARELRIRSDRRNKGEPRQGRVTGLAFEAASLVEVFEREFWTLFRSTEPEFKAKDFVADWLVKTAARYQGVEEEAQQL